MIAAMWTATVALILGTWPFWLVCGVGLVALMPLIRRWDADAEATRAAHDADDFHAQLAAMTDADVQAWREWAALVAATDGEDSPIYAELTRERFVADALAEIEDMTGGTAA